MVRLRELGGSYDNLVLIRHISQLLALNDLHARPTGEYDFKNTARVFVSSLYKRIEKPKQRRTHEVFWAPRSIWSRTLRNVHPSSPDLQEVVQQEGSNCHFSSPLMPHRTRYGLHGHLV